MENDVFVQASEVAVNDLSGVNAGENGHRRALESVESSPSPGQQSSHLSSPVQGDMHESYQQEVVNDTHSRPSLMLSHLEHGNHLTSDPKAADHSLSPCTQRRSRSPGSGVLASAQGNVVAQIRALIELHRLSREQLVSIYDDYVSERSEQRAHLSMSMAHAQAEAVAMLNSSSVVAGGGRSCRTQVVNSDRVDMNHGSPLASSHVHVQQQPQNNLSSSHVDVIDVTTNMTSLEEMDAAAATGDSSELDQEGGGEEHSNATTPAALIMDGGDDDDDSESSHVGKMQSLVRSALESYETASPVTSEIGQKRKHFTLEEELRLQPSPFAQQLLE